ncbi:abortive infection protein [Paractinoplanes deccanensis]|uniref:Abortive infection protein n=1 Tax=Paractinoplanes deccanensis TaxID=113561 RepID=A0ABQ3YL51_9ACTN|nr:CPBP family intramembrane glutamic endopeptidase [Actinoplanes deccanensis]GID80724.1 abortive infection protein [Actinoplanes deccanensis]
MAGIGEIAAVLLWMAAVRVWNYLGPPRAQPFVNPVATVPLILIGHDVGLIMTKTALVYAVTGAAVITVGYAVAARFVSVDRTERHPARTALIEIPLATVLFEEVAFRGVLLALAGPYWSSVLFGLWHFQPRRAALGAVLFTAAAGLVLAWGREASGSLLVPFVWHWAANGLGVLFFTRTPR